MKDLKGVLDIPCKLGTLNHHITKLLVYQMLPSTQFANLGARWDSALAQDNFVDANNPARAEDAIRRQPDWDYVNDAMNVGANPCPLTI